MHRVERPTKRRGLPFYLPAALALLAVMIIPEAARAQQWSCANGVCTTTGNVGVGTTTPDKSSVSKALTVNGGTDAVYELAVGDTRKGTVYHDGTTMSITNNVNAALTFGTNNGEKVRIDSSGNVGIGTTTPSQPLHVRRDQNTNTFVFIENQAAGSAAQNASTTPRTSPRTRAVLVMGTLPWVIRLPCSDSRHFGASDEPCGPAWTDGEAGPRPSVQVL